MKMKRALGGLICFFLLLTLVAVKVSADDALIILTSNSEHVLDIYGPSGGAYIIDGHGVERENVRIECKRGVRLTLLNVKIQNRNCPGPTVPITISGPACTLTMAGDGWIRSSPGQPGIAILEGYALTVAGTGKLDVQGGNGGAGIGGPAGDFKGTVIVNSGHLVASGVEQGAGIGGARDCSGGTVIVNGGLLEAIGHDGGAGIGGGGGHKSPIGGGAFLENGGNGGPGGTVTINGGQVNAISKGGGGAAIGGGGGGMGLAGGRGGDGGNVTINGGTVRAVGEEQPGSASGAGIGGGRGGQGIPGGNGGHGGRVTINGGMVYARCTNNIFGVSASIGGGGTDRLPGWEPVGGGGGDGADVVITGGSIDVGTGPEFINGIGFGGGRGGEALNGGPGTLKNNEGQGVFLNTVSLQGISAPTAIDSITATGGYGLHDVRTDDSGKIHIYLAENALTTYAGAASNHYYGSIKTASHHQNAGTLIPGLPAAITLTGQPQSLDLYEGQVDHRLEVSATVTQGASLSYQWYYNYDSQVYNGFVLSKKTDPFYVIPPGISLGTHYYYCVVSANYGAPSVASNIATVTVRPVPVYGMSLDPSASMELAPRMVGYIDYDWHTVRITNTGNQMTGPLTMTLGGSDADAFRLSHTSMVSIYPNSYGSFNISGKIGLAPGTYTATCTVTGRDEIEPQVLNISLTVNPDTLPPELFNISITRSRWRHASLFVTSNENATGYVFCQKAGDPEPTQDTVASGGQLLTGMRAGYSYYKEISIPSEAQDVYLMAVDEAGNRSQPLKVFVPGVTDLYISSEPQDATVTAGSISILDWPTIQAVASDGETITYTWFQIIFEGGVGIEHMITSGPSPLLPFTPDLLPGLYSYCCKVDATGGAFQVRSRTARINVLADQVTFTAEQVGGAPGSATSSGIRLTFDKPLASLPPGVITLTDGSGSVLAGDLSGSGTLWTLELDAVTAQGDVTVGIDSFGFYQMLTGPQTVAVYLDTRSPELSAGHINRTGHETATLGFTTDEAGTAFYLIQEKGEAPPEVSLILNSGLSLGTVAAGPVTGKAVTLTSGDKDLYLVVRDGEGNVSLPLKIEAAAYVAPTYLISISPQEKTFPSMVAGYSAASLEESFTLTNLGTGTLTNLQVTLSGPAFIIIRPLPVTELAPGQSVQVSLRPRVGLAAGTYTGTLTLGSQQTVTRSLPLSFIVNAKVTPDETAVPTTPSQPQTYSISAKAGQGGRVSPQGLMTAKAGDSLTLTIQADPGYIIASVTVDGVDQGAIGSYTFAGIKSNHTLEAAFIAQGQEPGYIQRTLTDSATGISISGLIREDAAFLVREFVLTDDAGCRSIHQRMQDEASLLLLAKDLSLTQDYRGSLTVSIPVDSAYNGQTLTLLHSSKGSMQTYTAKAAGGKAEFKLDNLSPLAVFAQWSLDQDGPQGPSAWLWWLLGGFLLLAALGLGAFLIRRKKVHAH